jgi:hypothetical protein
MLADIALRSDLTALHDKPLGNLESSWNNVLQKMRMTLVKGLLVGTRWTG